MILEHKFSTVGEVGPLPHEIGEKNMLFWKNLYEEGQRQFPCQASVENYTKILERMKKCSEENCPNNVFSHGYCKNHQLRRTDEKWLKQFAKKNGFVYNKIGKINNFMRPSSFLSIKKTPIKQKKTVTGESAMFNEIIQDRFPKSFVSGDKIDNPNFFNCDHVLTKQNYPEFRLYKRNVVLLTEQEHLDRHSLGKEELLKKDARWQKYFDFYDELKEEYYFHQKNNFLTLNSYSPIKT